MENWNVGNTTVRNPERIKAALTLLYERFDGVEWNEDAQQRFYRDMVADGLIEPKDGRLPPLQTQGINGRKWASAFNLLGLGRAWADEPVSLTGAGLYLVADEALEEEVFLRQLLKWQIPSAVEPLKKGIEGFCVQPFRLTLAIMASLQDLGHVGLTKEEIALFVLTAVRNDGLDLAIERISSYRRKRSALEGKARKKIFFHETRRGIVCELFQKEFWERAELLRSLIAGARRNDRFVDSAEGRELVERITAGGKGANTQAAKALAAKIKAGLTRGGDFDVLWPVVAEEHTSRKGDTLTDYADSMVRYFSKTGLFSISGERLVVRDSQWSLVRALVNEGLHMVSDADFVDYFGRADTPKLPTDDREFISANLVELEKRYKELRARVQPETAESEAPASVAQLDIPMLRRHQGELLKSIVDYKEELFYRQQREQVCDIIDCYDKIADGTLLGGMAYLPAYLEWTTWRAFLAINTIRNPISSTRNFQIDDEINPVHHAKPGHPDMVFDYGSFVIVGEVTLKTGESQWSAEGESVPRHVGDIVKEAGAKAVLGVFIAPVIHPQTAQQFFGQVWHVSGKEFVPLDIVPLTIEQVKALLAGFQAAPISVAELRSLLDTCCAAKKDAKNGVVWLARLTRIVDDWCCRRQA